MEIRRAAAAASQGQRGAIRDLLVRPRRRPARGGGLVQPGHAGHFLVHHRQGLQARGGRGRLSLVRGADRSRGAGLHHEIRLLSRTDARDREIRSAREGEGVADLRAQQGCPVAAERRLVGRERRRGREALAGIQAGAVARPHRRIGSRRPGGCARRPSSDLGER